MSYVGMIDRHQILTYGLTAGTNPPSGDWAALFPYSLRVRLSEFGYDFEGGMVVGKPGYQGTVYGVIGDWAGAGIAGLYHLRWGGGEQLIGVHDRALYIGAEPAGRTRLDGDELIFEDLPERLARSCHLPRSGRITFSADGEEVTGSSFGATGRRVHPDEAAVLAERLRAPGLAAAAQPAAAEAKADGHSLSDLVRMSQFAIDAQSRFYDIVQEGSMQDFHTILQNFMDPELRATFFNPNPPPLGDLRGIAYTKGSKGTDPVTWYRSLSVAYTASTLANFSDDPAARTLNGLRAETWIRNQTSVSDVMQVQGPMLYQRRYIQRYPNLDWFLVDQRANAAAHAPEIDAKVEEWIATARQTAVGTPEQIADLEKQMRALGDAAKKNHQYWAFALYTYTTSPAYLNMLQTVLLTGTEVDGSEFSQRVQRTVALLNVLDTTSYFSQEYAYLLQLFELAQLLPQLLDFSGKLDQFSLAVQAIIDKFIATYIDSPDPAMRDAAQRMRENASAQLVGRILDILRTSAAVGYGLGNWGFIAQTFERTCAKLLAGVPSIVVRMTAMCAAGALLLFFITGSADWGALDDTQRAFVVVGAVNLASQAVLAFVKRSVALAEVWTPGAKIRTNLAMFFKRDLLSKAQESATSGLRGWLLQTAGPKIPDEGVGFRQWWANRKLIAEASEVLPGKVGARTRFLRAVFGKNLSQFMARVTAGAFAIVGIVMSAISLSQSNEPLEKAANALFLAASVLELVAVIGSWALAGSALAVGGMLVSTIFAIVSGIGFVVFIVGAILMIILMSRPQPSPVEKFARNQSGQFYMPDEAAIESFRFYQPPGQPQRAGIAMLPLGSEDHALTVNPDGSVTQGAVSQDGHTAFFLSTDEFGRAQIGAPITDKQGRPVLFAIGTDDAGRVVTKNATGLDSPVDTSIMWHAEIKGPGSYEDIPGGGKALHYAAFKLRSAYWAERGRSRYLSADGGAGWTLTDGDGTVIQLRMVVTKPQELTMNDITWYTIAHDERTGPALQVAGSEPRHWALNPELPEGLEFDPADGTIRMRAGVNVPPAPKREYTITVANDVGALSTPFTLEVVVPAEQVALP